MSVPATKTNFVQIDVSNQTHLVIWYNSLLPIFLIDRFFGSVWLDLKVEKEWVGESELDCRAHLEKNRNNRIRNGMRITESGMGWE